MKQKLKSKSNWLTSEVRALIKKEFGVDYSDRQTRKILRGFKMHYAKPYPQDYRRPENAKELLTKALEEAAKNINGDCVIGFLDQAAPQTTDNRQRFWSFDKPRMIKNTTKYRANTFGFYPINGREVVEFMEHSTSEYVCAFLRLIRENNPVGRYLLILDNTRAHIAGKTKRLAKSLDITLVFLPTYSPHLNPIEQIWKSIRRRILKFTEFQSHEIPKEFRCITDLCQVGVGVQRNDTDHLPFTRQENKFHGEVVKNI